MDSTYLQNLHMDSTYLQIWWGALTIEFVLIILYNLIKQNYLNDNCLFTFIWI